MGTRIRRLLKKWGMTLSSKGPGFWRFVDSVPVLRRFFNRLFINLITNSTKPRPHPLSLWGPDATASTPFGAASADYVSWTGLVDRTYSGRHLPPADQSYLDALPALDKLRPLFQRQQQLTPCPKSTALFGFFAQWFTDSFLRTDPYDFRKTTSNHEIDLCQIYGLDAGDTYILRSHSGGLLRSEMIGGSEYPSRLFGADGLVKTEFLGLKYVDKDKRDLNPAIFTAQHFANMPERKPDLFVSGLERGNSTIFYSAISTIFLREHNRLCGEMAKRHPDWKDDRLFETARNTNIVELLKIIIGDYINHLSTALFHVYVDPGIADTQRWYRTNRIAAEFDLLYRWHPLAPTDFTLGDKLENKEFRYNNALLFKYGIEKIFDEGSKQHAGRIMLHNTPWFLVDFEIAALQKSRYWRLQSYNAYRECFDLDPMSSFEELTGDKALAAELEALYGKVDNVEFTVGLLAEQRPANAPIGETMMYMVGGDAFSQALTNPLLANGIYCEDCFSDVGVEALKATSTFADIVQRNIKSTGGKVSFDI